MKFVMSVCLCCVVVCFVNVALAEDVDFKIIVNASNPSAALSAKEISKLFLKKITAWKEGGEQVNPVDLVEDFALRERFSEDIHGRKVSSIKSYWQKKIFSGRGVPPLEKESELEVLEFVAKNIGAIGYVSAGMDLVAYEVKAIEVQK